MYQLKPVTQVLVGYVRVSTQGQKENESLPDQALKIEQYCEKLGHHLAAIFRDIESGESMEGRPGFKAALEYTREHADGLIVYSLDRYSRSLGDSEIARKSLQRAGKKLLSVQEGFDLDDDLYGVMTYQMRQVISELERKMIRKRTSDGLAAKVARGGWAGARPTYGYFAQGGELVPDLEEQQVCRYIARLYKWCGHNQQEITRHLNALYAAEKLKNPAGPHKFAPKQMRPTTGRKSAFYSRYKSFEWGQPSVRNILIRLGLNHIKNSTRGRPPKNPTATYTRDGKPPYGHYRIFGTLTPNPGEQLVLRFLRRLYKWTLVSPAAMAKLLNCLREDAVKKQPDSDRFACRAVSNSKLQNISWSEGCVMNSTLPALPNAVTEAMHRAGYQNIWDLAKDCDAHPTDVYRSLSPSCILTITSGAADELAIWLRIIDKLKLTISDVCAVLRQ